MSRRLYGTEDNIEGYNLLKLLTEDNTFSRFLKSRGLEFYEKAQHIETFYKIKIIDWDDCVKCNSS